MPPPLMVVELPDTTMLVAVIGDRGIDAGAITSAPGCVSTFTSVRVSEKVAPPSSGSVGRWLPPLPFCILIVR